MAGGTDIYPAHTARAAWGSSATGDILDISGIDALAGISGDETGWRIGARTTWMDIITADLPPLFDGLKAAAREVGGVQIQNRGTIAGNLVTASPAGDGIPCLMALGAEIELASTGGTRRLAIEDFNTGYRRTALRADELVTAIHVPKPAGESRGGFVKLGARRYLVISIVMASAVIEVVEDKVTAARIAVGACSPAARRIPALEARLPGRSLDTLVDCVEPGDADGLDPIDDIRASGPYRRHAAIAALRDLLAQFATGERVAA